MTAQKMVWMEAQRTQNSREDRRSGLITLGSWIEVHIEQLGSHLHVDIHAQAQTILAGQAPVGPSAAAWIGSLVQDADELPGVDQGLHRHGPPVADIVDGRVDIGAIESHIVSGDG